MMDKDHDGAAAFPYQGQPMTRDGKWAQDYETGMTLRDYFAGQALAGLSVGCAGMLGDEFSAYAKGHCNAALSNRAYTLADVMLAEREKERGS